MRVAAEAASPESRYPAMKPERVIARVLPRHETVDPFDDVLAAELGAIPVTRLRSTIACGSCSSYSSRMSLKKIGMSVRPSGLETCRLDRDSVPGNTVIFLHHAATPSAKYRSHPVSKTLRDLHFAGAGMDFRIVRRPFPARLENLQNRVAAFAVDVDELPAKHAQPRRNVQRHVARPPYALSLTTASASSKPHTPNQCRRAAGLMIDTSSLARTRSSRKPTNASVTRTSVRSPIRASTDFSGPSGFTIFTTEGPSRFSSTNRTTRCARVPQA